MRVLKTVGTVLALATLLVLGGASLADAGSVFAGYVTQVTAVRPALPGVRAVAAANGSYITVSNSSPTPLIVDGYQHEPYLLITDHGVWQNRLSPAVYLNKEQFIDTIPRDVDANKPPVWVKVDGLSSARWHDHRIHWMDVSQPPSVSADPSRSHLIKRWTIPISSHGNRGVIAGTLTWYPSRHFVRYLTWGIIGVALVVAVGVPVLVRRRRRGRTGPDPERRESERSAVEAP